MMADEGIGQDIPYQFRLYAFSFQNITPWSPKILISPTFNPVRNQNRIYRPLALDLGLLQITIMYLFGKNVFFLKSVSDDNTYNFCQLVTIFCY